MNRSTVKLIWTLIGFAISACAIYWFRDYVPKNFIQGIFQDKAAFLIGSAVLFVSYLVRGYKSALLLSARPSQRKIVFLSLYASIAANNLFPMRAGDLIRLFFLRGVAGFSLLRATAALLIERVFDLFAIVFLTVVFGFALGGRQLFALIMQEPAHYAKWIVLIMVAGVAGLAAALLLRRRLYAMTLRYRNEINFTWPMMRRLALAALLQWMLEIPLLAISVAAVLGSIHIQPAILGAFMSNLSTLVPSAPGYVGTFEVAGVLPFSLLEGRVEAQAALFVLIYHAVIWLFSTGLGIIAAGVLLPELLKQKRKSVG